LDHLLRNQQAISATVGASVGALPPTRPSAVLGFLIWAQAALSHRQPTGRDDQMNPTMARRGAVIFRAAGQSGVSYTDDGDLEACAFPVVSTIERREGLSKSQGDLSQRLRSTRDLMSQLVRVGRIRRELAGQPPHSRDLAILSDLTETGTRLRTLCPGTSRTSRVPGGRRTRSSGFSATGSIARISGGLVRAPSPRSCAPCAS